MTAPTSRGASPARDSASRAPSRTARTGSCGVVRTLTVWQAPLCSTATSVNVPPMSTASRGRVIGLPRRLFLPPGRSSRFRLERASGVPADRTAWRDLAVMGILNNAIPFGLIVWGQVWITGGLASVMSATQGQPVEAPTSTDS